jgi:hypothetical protein
MDPKPLVRSETAEHLSKDKQWRSFPKIPHLLQYVSNSVYYARVKVNGKIIRRSLETDLRTTAKLKLLDFLKAEREIRPVVGGISFVEALKLLKTDLDLDSSLKESSRQYRKNSIRKIEISWPELWRLADITQLSSQECQTWALRLHANIAG